MNVHAIIDAFVASVDPSSEIFSPIESAPWIELLEVKLPRRFPASFRSLITRYTFPSFDVGGLSFFSNSGTDSHEEMSVAIFKDSAISVATLSAGFIQFARPDSGSYDPACFDARRATSNREFPLVRIDHEDILCRGTVRVREILAKSFYQFAIDIIERG